ncbi:MAG: tetratricopeptide repeat protein [Candidatus Binatia bacterium]
MSTKWLNVLAPLVAAICCLAWMNPTRDRIAEGNRLVKKGKFDEAIKKYGEVLVNDPDSPLLNFNMGVAKYKAGKYAEAITSFARVRAGDDAPQRVAKTAYNAGNAEYRLGEAAEATKPEDALKAYAGALAAYRRALGADPTDRDAKFNYEFVSKKIDALKKALEEQQQQQDQAGKPNHDKQQPQPSDKQQPEQQKEAAAQQQASKHKAGEKQQPAASAAAAGDQKNKDEMSPQEATALIDTAKNDELRPEEFARQAQGAVVAEPAQDW